VNHLALVRKPARVTSVVAVALGMPLLVISLRQPNFLRRAKRGAFFNEARAKRVKASKKRIAWGFV
tara:strand:+ start:178 stop:375 length:198 start_codon:yes stop_codon:yes gene_type:complete